MAASIADVAKLANVSISTVSRVLNRRELVNDKTRARVEAAIAQLGYTPNAFARGLMLRRSEVVGLILPDLHGEFYSEIIRGANDQAREFGYSLMISSSRDGDDGHSLLQSLQNRTLLDGVAVMVSELTDHVQEVLRDFRLPFVVLDADVEGTPHDCVIIDQRHGAVALMRHLVQDGGRRRIFFVGGLETNVDTIARFHAYKQVLAESEIPLREADIAYLDYGYDTAYRFALERVRDWAGLGASAETPAAPSPTADRGAAAGTRGDATGGRGDAAGGRGDTASRGSDVGGRAVFPASDEKAAGGRAVFAANDEMAAGIIAAAAACGVRVPEQLAVVGFDDTRIAKMTRPALTTVRVPMSRMGAEAIRLLCERIADPQRAPTRVTLQPELVVRDSCGSGAASL